jgi:hypothetical protein
MAIKVGKQRDWVRNVAGKQKLVPLLERAIDGPEFEWDAKFSIKEKDDAWHPSGDCTPSLFELYDKATRPQVSDFSMSLKKTFAVGHFWHAYLQHVAVECAQVCNWDEVELRGVTGWGHGRRPNPFPHIDGEYISEPFHWATGSMDLRCDIPGFGEYVVDFKTMGQFDFNVVLKGKAPDWCSKKYEAQINIYMDWAGLDRALIFCIQKDSPHNFRELEYRRNDDLIQGIYTKWQIVSQCLEEGIVPPEDEEFELPFTGPRS